MAIRRLDHDVADDGRGELGPSVQPGVDGPGRLEADGKTRSAVGEGRRPGDPAASDWYIAIEQLDGSTGGLPGDDDPHGHRSGGKGYLRRHSRDLCRHVVVGEVEPAVLDEEHVPT